MQTRSQTAVASIAVNAMTFMDNINEDVSRKTRFIRHNSFLENPFTILTRSKTRELLKKTTFDIDFDAASKVWNQNKKRIGNGCYTYK